MVHALIELVNYISFALDSKKICPWSLPGPEEGV